MKNSKGNIRLFATEQMPDKEQMAEKLLKALKSLDRSDIEFSVKNMKIEGSGDIRETGISFKPDANQNAIGVIKLEVIDINHVRQALVNIDKTVSILSLFYGVGDWEWEHRMHMPKTKFSAVLRQEPRDLKSVDDALKLISDKSDKLGKKEIEVYLRALEWYRFGINSKSPFNRFLAFYNSIELFSEGTSEIKKSKTEKDKCIKEYFKDLSITSISEIERRHINDCYKKCLETSSKDKMMFAFEKVFDGIKEKISEFSKKFFEGDKNFYWIRNAIAHGNLSEYREDDKTFVKKNLRDIHFMAQEFLKKIIS